MGIMSWMNNRKERRAMAKQTAEASKRWDYVMNEAVEDGAVPQTGTNPDGSMLIVMNEVPDKWLEPLRQLGFSRVHKESPTMWLRVPPQTQRTGQAPEQGRDGSPAQAKTKGYAPPRRGAR
jgi:hypothetical protein